MGGFKAWRAGCFNEAAAHHRGERSRVDPAARRSAASMRPRLITAENVARYSYTGRHVWASMRPRLITAENPLGAPRPRGPARRFNEAAAHHRGERLLGLGRGRAGPASMRPRLITAENAPFHLPDELAAGASMRPRLITAENAGTCRVRGRVGDGFNEAAAHHRGERRRPLRAGADRPGASMRPRLITAENAEQGRRHGLLLGASMRPRLITAENSAPTGSARRRAALQ